MKKETLDSIKDANNMMDADLQALLIRLTAIRYATSNDSDEVKSAYLSDLLSSVADIKLRVTAAQVAGLTLSEIGLLSGWPYMINELVTTARPLTKAELVPYQYGTPVPSGEDTDNNGNGNSEPVTDIVWFQQMMANGDLTYPKRRMLLQDFIHTIGHENFVCMVLENHDQEAWWTPLLQ